MFVSRSKFIGNSRRRMSGYGYGRRRNKAASTIQRFFRRKTYSSASARSRRWRPGSKLAGYVRMRFNRRAALQRVAGMRNGWRLRR